MTQSLVFRYKKDEHYSYIFETNFDIQINIGSISVEGEIELDYIEEGEHEDVFVYRITNLKGVSIVTGQDECAESNLHGYLPIGDSYNG